MASKDQHQSGKGKDGTAGMGHKAGQHGQDKDRETSRERSGEQDTGRSSSRSSGNDDNDNRRGNASR